MQTYNRMKIICLDNRTRPKNLLMSPKDMMIQMKKGVVKNC